MRGAQVSAEYAGLGSAVDDRGFFDTRDDGFLDADGYLFVSGRTDDTIIRGAENIAPAEIEDVLLRHPAVLDAVVFGVPDQEWGQRIEAAVVPRPETDLDPADLREFTLRALRSSKTPDRFWLLDELPRTETGKLLRRMVPGLIPPAKSNRTHVLQGGEVNESHLRYLASPQWAATVRDELFPWVLRTADLGDDCLEVGPGPGVTTDLLRARARTADRGGARHGAGRDSR